MLQAEAAECGLACLAMVSAAHGGSGDIATLRRRFGSSARGVTLERLARHAEALGLLPRAVRAEPGELRRLALPAVLHWNLDHFVVLERVGNRTAVVLDPALGRRHLPLARLGRHFTGVALELTRAATFRPRQDGRPLRLRDLAAGCRGLGRSLAGLVLVSLALQALALLAPYYSQLVFDEVVLRGDRALLELLLAGFMLLVAVQVLLSMARGWLVIALGTRLELGWSARVYAHLLRLPLAWFERRQVGDVQSRFAAIGALRRLLAREVVEALIDGGMALTTLALMAAYDARLAAVAAAAALGYAALRAALYPALRAASLETLAAAAVRESAFLESVRGLLAIKTCGLEQQREALFHARQVAAANAAVAAGRLGLWQLGGRGLLFGWQGLLVTALGAGAILDGRLTVGMLIAFTGFAALFTGRAAALVDRLFEFRLAGVQLARLADIVDTPAEVARDEGPPRRPPRRPPSLAVRGLAFRHAADEPWLFRGLDLAIAAGEHVVVTGPSGCGKSTLLKLLAGLLAPDAGELLVDGRPLARYGRQRYRAMLAAVMQEDRLFSGTVADNIAQFPAVPDRARCRACARIAELDATIEAWPLGYASPIGDMGSQLSGGERQRLLLARALYRAPRILLLDEFTSHLDAPAEARIHARLARLGVTRIVVAHRRESLRHAHRELRLRRP